ncbi:hypothetical protein [Mesobacillus jeotgali]|uniref:hypothetical protein n=1 Tax=Mesobacillus jeotgali TaxID=129985 RepID=UPI0009A89DA2|nr:hypothetical protein [Mesobacillus jeotgali]
MKILFVSMVSFENNTSATIQNKGIIKGLSSIGHEVDILTLRPDPNSFSFDDSINDIKDVIKDAYYIDIDKKYSALMSKKSMSMTQIENTAKVNILKLIKKNVRKFLKKIYEHTSIFDAQKINVKGVSNVNIDYSKYDFIISASDPKSSHLIVEKIIKENKLFKGKYIQYWGDPMYNDITRESDWRDVLVKHKEKRLLSLADKIVYASPLTLKIQKKTYPELAYKMDYANQVYINESYEQKGLEKVERVSSRITVGYFGAYDSSVRNIVPLYNAGKTADFNLNICGATDLSLPSINNVYIHGMLSYQQAVKMEKESNILICICNKRGTQIPGKLYYSTGYQKPIVVILDSEYKEELKEYLQSFKRFILCENEEGSIKEAIEKAKNQLAKRDFPISKNLTPEFMAQKILDIN